MGIWEALYGFGIWLVLVGRSIIVLELGLFWKFSFVFGFFEKDLEIIF